MQNLSINHNKLIKNSYKHHFKRKRKQRKRHAERFFRSRLQRFNYYYTKFNSFFVLKNKLINNRRNLTNMTGKFKFAVKSSCVYYLKPGPLISILKLSKKYLRKNYIEDYLKYKMSVFPNLWFTSKPKAVRMGKGKGEKKRKIYILKKGEMFYELRMKKFNKKYFRNDDFFFNVINLKIYFFLKKIKHKLPIKNKIAKKKF